MPHLSLREWVTIAYITLLFVGSIIGFWLFYKITRGLVRVVGKVSVATGEDTKTLLISFAIANLFFPSTLLILAQNLSSFFLELFARLGQRMTAAWSNSLSQCDLIISDLGIGVSDCIGRLGLGFFTACIESLIDAYNLNELQSWPFVSLLFILAFWVIIAQILGQSVQMGSPTNQPRWLFAMRGLSEAKRKNMLFFLLLIIAGYLSIAAIAAIPGLQENVQTSAEVSVENLRQQLNVSLEAAKKPDITSLSQNDPFVVIQQLLNPLPKKEPTEASSPEPTVKAEDVRLVALPESIEKGETRRINAPTNYIENVKYDLSWYRNYRRNLVETYNSLVKRYQDRKEAAKAQALRTYEISNINRKGNREKADHFLIIATWYSGFLHDLDDQGSKCYSELLNMDNLWRRWSDEREGRLISWNDRAMPYDPLSRQVHEVYNNALNNCNYSVRSVAERVPDRPAMGSNLGPFSIVASWLLRTESLSLALIVGLFGFGLLGSACSTFIRERSQRQSGDALVTDLSNVLIRGLSAAIVVFLAVEGGLAVFSAGQSDPNPYVLLLTCLIAAVFSETVWEWARARLQENFPTVQRPNGGGQAPTPPDAPPSSL